MSVSSYKFYNFRAYYGFAALVSHNENLNSPKQLREYIYSTRGGPGGVVRWH